jgi:hypothetical protein
MSDCRIAGGARAGTAESPITESAHSGSLAHVASPRSSRRIRRNPTPTVRLCSSSAAEWSSPPQPTQRHLAVPLTPPTSTTLTCLCQRTDTGDDQRSRADPSGRLGRTDCPEMFRRLQGRACPLPPAPGRRTKRRTLNSGRHTGGRCDDSTMSVFAPPYSFPMQQVWR